MPVVLITFAYLAISSATYFLNSLTGIVMGSTPKFSNLAFKSGSVTLALIAAFSLSTMSSGVPVVAQMPYQPAAA